MSNPPSSLDLLPDAARRNSSLALSSLSQRSGSNRAPKCDSQIEADNDIAAVQAWMALFTSPRTVSNYRKDVSRLIYWCMHFAGKPISGLKYEDMLRYREFLIAPPPECIGSPGAENYDHRAHPLTEKWRPFRTPLSPNSVRQSFVVLRTLFEFLVMTKYLKVNPIVLLMKSVRRPVHERHRTAMPDAVLMALFDGIDQLQDDDTRIRAQWIFRFLLFTGLRATEVVEAKASGLYCDTHDQSLRSGRWYLKVLGKGQKLRSVAFSNDLFPYLMAMRERAGLSAQITPDDHTPMVFLSFSGKKTCARAVTRQSLHSFLKTVCSLVASDMTTSNRIMAEQIQHLHAHIFRHTAATMWIANGASLADARDNLGHSSLSTLSRYVNPEQGNRHDAITKATFKI